MVILGTDESFELLSGKRMRYGENNLPTKRLLWLELITALAWLKNKEELIKSALSVNCLKQLRIMQLFDKKRNLFDIAI